jgi:hypothetical protein
MSDILESLRRAVNQGPFAQTGVGFVCDGQALQRVYNRAARDLMACVAPAPSGSLMFIEGAMFIGCWLESTGTISAETLSRFRPDLAQTTMEQFAVFQRDDGLIPYKVTAQGPAYRQIQMVTPLARSVWRHHSLRPDSAFLARMYAAMARNDAWLAKRRDTRGTGCVEAFCTFDTGHDESPRFWHVPDTCYGDDPARYDPDSPILPFLAPDLTANAYCQRKYLARIAREVGEDDAPWLAKAAGSLQSLMTHCYDPADGFFYDRDALGRFVRVQGDNLIRVLACEVGDDAFFAACLRRYLLNTKKFFPRYPITTIAMDDPGFCQDATHNSWAGQPSFLTQLRLPTAFELHRRYVELGWIMTPTLAALSRFTEFAGSMNPWLGQQGYAQNYTPAMLCLLDYAERTCGILPTPEGELWFTGLIPKGVSYGEVLATRTAYSRRVDGVCYEQVNTPDGVTVCRDGKALYRFPLGVRLVTDRAGEPRGIIGMRYRPVVGKLWYNGEEIPFAARGNETLRLQGGAFISADDPGVAPPGTGEV